MKYRKIKDEERPKCSICGKPMEWHLSKTYYEDIYGWCLTCDCVDEGRLEPDHTEKFIP